MSKIDALRALREEKYAANRARASAPGRPAPAAPRGTPKAAVAKPAVAQPVNAPTPEASEGLCGHRNLSGRTCTREHGHAAKSHRYS